MLPSFQTSRVFIEVLEEIIISWNFMLHEDRTRCRRVQSFHVSVFNLLDLCLSLENTLKKSIGRKSLLNGPWSSARAVRFLDKKRAFDFRTNSPPFFINKLKPRRVPLELTRRSIDRKIFHRAVSSSSLVDLNQAQTINRIVKWIFEASRAGSSREM